MAPPFALGKSRPLAAPCGGSGAYCRRNGFGRQSQRCAVL